MNFIWSIIPKEFYFYFSTPVLQIIVWILMLIFALFFLFKIQSLNFKFNRQRKFFFVILFLFTPVASLLFGIEFFSETNFSTPFVPIHIEYIALPLSFFPLIIAGIYLGPLYASILASISGFLIGGFVTHNLFTIWLFVFVSIIFTFFIRQNFNLSFYNFLRNPIISFIVIVFLYPLFSLIFSFLFIQGNFSIRIEFFISQLGLNWIVFIINLFFTALILQFIKLVFPQFWVEPRDFLLFSRNKKIMDSVNFLFIPVLFISFFFLVVFNWYQTGEYIQINQRDVLIKQAERIDENIFLLLSSGKTLIKQYSNDEVLLFDDFKKIKVFFEELINNSDFFDNLILLDQNLGVLVEYSDAQGNGTNFSSQQKEMIQLAYNDLAFQIYPFVIKDKFDVSELMFVVPVYDTNQVPYRILVAMTRLNDNPYYTSVLENIENIEKLEGNTIILSPQNEILYATDSSSLFLVNENYKNEFFDTINFLAIPQINYSKISEITGWKIINSIPIFTIRSISFSSRSSFLISVAFVFILLIILLNVFSRQLSQSINLINKKYIQNKKIDKKISYLPVELMKIKNRSILRQKEFYEIINTKDFFIKLREIPEFRIQDNYVLDLILEESLKFNAESVRIILFEKEEKISKGKGALNSKFESIDVRILPFLNDEIVQIISNKNELKTLFYNHNLIPESVLILRLFDDQNNYGFIWSAYFHVHSFSEQEIQFMKDLSLTLVDLIKKQKNNFDYNDKSIFKTSFENYPDVIFEIDSDGFVIDANSKARDMFEINYKYRIDDIPIINNNKRFYFMFRGNPNEIDQCELEWENKIFQITVKKVYSSIKDFSWLCVMQDFTSLRYKELNANHLLLSVNNDFRNSIRILQDNIDMINEINNNSSLSYHINSIESQILHLKNKTNSLLNKNRLENDNVLEKTSFNFESLVNVIVDRLKPEIMQKSIKIEADNLNKNIFADKNLFEIALYNVLENAIKASKIKGAIQIKLIFENDNYLISIKDNGIGISPADIDNIFNPYFQVNSDEKNGYGLGLYLSKKIIEKHDGEINCISQLGNGSTFKIIIPNH